MRKLFTRRDKKNLVKPQRENGPKHRDRKYNFAKLFIP